MSLCNYPKDLFFFSEMIVMRVVKLLKSSCDWLRKLVLSIYTSESY